MEIKHKELKGQGIFFIEENGHTAGRMTYRWEGEDMIVIEHTNVDEVLKGKGAGKQLVASAVQWAREKKFASARRAPSR
jgi:uncharacterized protein